MLGVASSASTDEIRAAYVGLARRHHPDASGGESGQMQLVNAAWAVLSDPSARRKYDLQLGEPRRAQVFVPLDDEDDDDEWRYLPDVGDPRTSSGPAVLMIPIGLLVAAATAVGLWLVVGQDALLVTSLILAAMAVVGFVALPIVAMAKAARFESEE